MEISAREYNQNASRVLARAAQGEEVIVTKNGMPYVRMTAIDKRDIPNFPPGPIGDIDIPVFDGPGLSDDEIEQTLHDVGEAHWQRMQDEETGR